MGKKRPGVDAAIELLSSSGDDVDEWEAMEASHLEHVFESIEINKKKLTALYKQRNDLLKKNELDSDDLMTIVLWKFAVGKPRWMLLSKLKSNSSDEVKIATRSALATVRGSVDGDETIKRAMNQLTVLKGVGPATASAILSLYRPEAFCYMYDEMIDVFEDKRDYTLAQYLRVNSKCKEIAAKLGSSWNSARVARTLWLAARQAALATTMRGKTDRPASKRQKR